MKVENQKWCKVQYHNLKIKQLIKLLPLADCQRYLEKEALVLTWNKGVVRSEVDLAGPGPGFLLRCGKPRALLLSVDIFVTS